MSIYSQALWLVVIFTAGMLLSGNVTSRKGVGIMFGAALCAASLLLEIGSEPLIGYLRALMSEPSLGLAVYCLLLCRRRKDAWAATGSGEVGQDRFLGIVLILGLLLYPMALGLGMFDPYALGYRPECAIAISVLAALAWWQERHRLIATWLTAALLMHALGVGESDNLIDYLLDPIIFVVSFIQVIRLPASWRGTTGATS